MKQVTMIEVQEWDDLVENTYNRPYSFQQQDGCKERGTYSLTVPGFAWDYENDTVPETLNLDDMGVSFKAWLNRDPKQKLNAKYWDSPSAIHLWWTRYFYPSVEIVANDLHAKGLLPAGEYIINIDW